MYTLELTRHQLCDLAGYTYRWLHDIDMKLPEEQRLFVTTTEGSQKCDVGTFIRRWVDFNVSRETNDADMDFDQVKTEHEKAKKRKTELQVQQMEGALIPVRDVKRIWGTVIDAARKNFLQLPNQLAPQLMMMDNAERIAGIIGEAIRGALEDIANTPLPSYVAEEEDDGE